MSEKSADPVKRVQEAARQQRLKRFYKAAGVEEGKTGFAVRLDGRAVRTLGKAPLAVPARAIAEGIAAEWDAQGDYVDPATMPLTRLANTIIDGVAIAGSRAAVIDEIVSFGASDLLCYRAEEPDGLVERERAAWDPVLAWARDRFGARFRLAAGIVHVEQDPAILDKLRQDIENEDSFVIGALASMTNLTGSALLPLAVLRGFLSAGDAWAAAHVDEDWQISLWGADAEAAARRAFRWKDMAAAAQVLAALA